MNESIDLRKRILKMRENNDFIINSAKQEHFKEDVKIDIKSDEVIKINKEKFNSSNEKKIFNRDENILNSSLLKKKISSPIHSENHHSDNQKNINLVDTNEAQFRMLANKFNEAVEVILELSDKVKKIEHSIYNNNNQMKKKNSIFYYINMKILFSMIFISLLILVIFTLPFDFYTFKLIFSDIISSM
ncbi:hypothetical protein OAM56_00390 [Alphaproteobacteria bacterium]|nr:hypothetical protein [Alphaproteobacteria bacterium]